MFIPTIFVVAPNYKQPQIPSIVEWINRWWYFHSGKLLAKKGWTISSHDLDESQNYNIERKKITQSNEQMKAKQKKLPNGMQMIWFYLKF